MGRYPQPQGTLEPAVVPQHEGVLQLLGTHLGQREEGALAVAVVRLHLAVESVDSLGWGE